MITGKTGKLEYYTFRAFSTVRQWSWGGGNVFSRVFLSFCSQRFVRLPCDHCQGYHRSVIGHMSPTPIQTCSNLFTMKPGLSVSRRLAFDWNAFLYLPVFWYDWFLCHNKQNSDANELSVPCSLLVDGHRWIVCNKFLETWNAETGYKVCMFLGNSSSYLIGLKPVFLLNILGILTTRGEKDNFQITELY